MNITDYNQRQYGLMLDLISNYRQRKIELSKLVNELDALNSVLESPSQSWVNKFEAAWARLEDVYAVMITDGRSELDNLDLELINKSLNELEELIPKQVDELKT